MPYRRKIIFMLLLLQALLPCRRLEAQTDSNRVKSYQDYENQSYEQGPATGSTPQKEEQAESEGSAHTTDPDNDVYAEEQEKKDHPALAQLKWPLLLRDRNVSDVQWKKLVSDDAFQYEEPPQKNNNSSENSWWSHFFMAIANFLQSGLGTILLVVIVSLLVLFLIVRVFQLRGNIFFARKDKKIGPEKQDELSDHFVPDSWEKVIEDAARSGNYRLAVRHSYRYFLSLLQEKELISSQSAKTNYQYAYELSGTKLHTPFLHLTRSYEYAWYGGFTIAKDKFEAYYNEINSLKKDLL